MNAPLETYPEPSAILSSASKLHLAASSRGEISTLAGVPVEIEHLAGIGWSLEVRYDLLGSGRVRQPFTGEQARRERRELRLTQQHGGGAFSAGDEELAFHAAASELQYRVRGEVVWRSGGCPFFSHPEPVKILDELHSIEHTGFEEPTPWRPEPVYLETTMARFCCGAPTGAIIGLPGQAGEFNRKGYRFELFNNDQPVHIPSRPPMYQSWPMIIHRDAQGAGWVGIFHDNPARTFVDLGDFYKETVVFESIANNTRVYIVRADTLAGITQKFVALLGTPVFPPAWAFGYQQCRYSYMSTAELRRVAARFRSEDIPCDALYFDIDYMDGYRVFTKNEAAFGDMRSCLDELHREGFQSVCIIDPGVKIDPGYPVYEELVRNRAVLTGANGEPFEIVCWPGKAVLPDFLDHAVRERWAEMQRRWLAEFHFDGVWNDMNEPANFDGGRAKTSTALSSVGALKNLFNLYGPSMAEASALGWAKARPAERGVVITRSGYPGVQRHAVIWHGDNHAWWEHLRLAVDTAVAYSVCGAFYTGPDVPGFFGNPPEDLAVRFFQLGAFLPLFRGHSFKLANSKEPFAYSAAAVNRITAAIKLRYSLMTEWYSNFERCIGSGEPPLEPVFSDDGSPVRDSFILFDKFLVGAVTNRDEAMKPLWLPAGLWYRLGEPAAPIEGGRWITEPVTLEAIPVFVKGGAVVVRNTPGKNVAATLAGPTCYEVYRDRSGEARGYVFRDDGRSTNIDAGERREIFAAAGSAACGERPVPR